MTGRRGHRLGALLGLALLMPGTLLLAGNPNEREVTPKGNVQDTDSVLGPDGKTINLESKVWVLNFKFKDPRLITTDVPGRGRKVCWYLWYQVTNPYRDPKPFIPEFELVTLDKNTVHRDQILPSVQDAIAQIEDPTGYLKIKSTVTIMADPVPPSKPDAFPKAVTGVAIWDDVDPDTNRFSIFIRGLSNGYAETDPVVPGGEPVVRRKTLQLNFRKLGDRFFMESREIKFEAPAEWVYRASRLPLPKAVEPKKEEKTAAPAAAPQAVKVPAVPAPPGQPRN